jgi:hypothetical protein
MTRRRVLAAASLAALVLASAACGVPSQEHPEVVDHDDVPFGLTEESPSRPPPTTVPVTPDRRHGD